MKRYRSFSITKFGETINEDSVLINEDLIAISDGAGGGGVFADEWSRYLLDTLPSIPFNGFEDFDTWLNGISDKFYDEHEIIAKEKGSLFLEKFYDEGAFATLCAIWRIADDEFIWASYGDSVAFAYNPAENELIHSFTSLVDFNQPPFLISLLSPVNRKGFHMGRFKVSQGSYIFVASDALAHYVLAMYYSTKNIQSELSAAIESKSRNSSYVKALSQLARKNFFKDVVFKFSKNATSNINSYRILEKLYKNGLIGLDDYSLAFMPKTGCDTEYSDEYIFTHFAGDIAPRESKPRPPKFEEYNGEIKTLEEYFSLKDTLAHIRACGYKIYFRGHANFKWQLVPSLMRIPQGTCEAEKKNYKHLRDFLISEGYDRCRLKGFSEELYYLGIGRHLGLCSRLLDWSAGLDDAADAFLLDGENDEIDGAIWIMFVPNDVVIENASPFDIMDNDIHIFAQGFYIPDESTSADFPIGLKRRLVQHGIFTATSEKVMNLSVANIPTKNGVSIEKMRVPKELKIQLKQERDKKKFQTSDDSYVNHNVWYLGELPESVQQEIDNMNKFIKSVD